MLLGRAGSGSARRRPGEARSVSCERLRDGTGGGGSREEASGDGVESEEEDDESSACRSDRTEGWREEDEGRVLEDANVDTGTEGGARREEPLVRDWVVCQEDDEEERTSEASVPKGSGFHCASLWIPFSPLVCHPEGFSSCAAGAVSDLAASGGRV